nr:hypothetical protein [uncultured bacterium]
MLRVSHRPNLLPEIGLDVYGSGMERHVSCLGLGMARGCFCGERFNASQMLAFGFLNKVVGDAPALQAALD